MAVSIILVVAVVVLLVWAHLVPAVSVHRLLPDIVLMIEVHILAAVIQVLPEVLMAPLVAPLSVVEVIVVEVDPSEAALVVAALAAAAVEAHALVVVAVVATLEAEDNQQLFNRFTYNYDEEIIFSSFCVCRYTAHSCTGYL
jgi:hypothetical protein